MSVSFFTYIIVLLFPPVYMAIEHSFMNKSYTAKIYIYVYDENFCHIIPFNYNTRKHSSWLNEKLLITLYEGKNLLNKKTELILKWRHQKKFMSWRHDFSSKEAIILQIYGKFWLFCKPEYVHEVPLKTIQRSKITGKVYFFVRPKIDNRVKH